MIGKKKTRSGFLPRSTRWLKSTNKWQRLGLLAVFILLFAGVGVFVNRYSLAASGCTSQTYGDFYPYNASFHSCTNYINSFLSEEYYWHKAQHNGYGDPNYNVGHPSGGIYGAATANAIRSYQNYYNTGTADGVVSAEGPTWGSICRQTYTHNFDDGALAKDLGCSSLPL